MDAMVLAEARSKEVPLACYAALENMAVFGVRLQLVGAWSELKLADSFGAELSRLYCGGPGQTQPYRDKLREDLGDMGYSCHFSSLNHERRMAH